MPSDYECPQCHLGFSVGWFHYHRHESGYGGRTLLVCTACGVQHSIEHPLNADPQAGNVDSLESYPTQVIDSRRVAGNHLFPELPWVKRTPLDGSAVEKLKCQNCTAEGALVRDWKASYPCPKCGTTIGEPLVCWMT